MIRDHSRSPWPFSRNDSSPHLSDFGRSQYPFLCFVVSSSVSIPYPCNHKTIPIIFRYLQKVHWFLGFLLSRHIRSYFQVSTFCSSLLSRSLFILSPSLFHYHIPSYFPIPVHTTPVASCYLPFALATSSSSPSHTVFVLFLPGSVVILIAILFCSGFPLS